MCGGNVLGEVSIALVALVALGAMEWPLARVHPAMRFELRGRVDAAATVLAHVTRVAQMNRGDVLVEAALARKRLVAQVAPMLAADSVRGPVAVEIGARQEALVAQRTLVIGLADVHQQCVIGETGLQPEALATQLTSEAATVVVRQPMTTTLSIGGEGTTADVTLKRFATFVHEADVSFQIFAPSKRLRTVVAVEGTFLGVRTLVTDEMTTRAERSITSGASMLRGGSRRRRSSLAAIQVFGRCVQCSLMGEQRLDRDECTIALLATKRSLARVSAAMGGQHRARTHHLATGVAHITGVHIVHGRSVGVQRLANAITSATFGTTKLSAAAAATRSGGAVVA